MSYDGYIYTLHRGDIRRIIYKLYPEVLFFNIRYENNNYGAAVLDTPADELMFLVGRKYRRYKTINVEVDKNSPSVLRLIFVPSGSENSKASNYLGFLDLEIYKGEYVTLGTTEETNIPAEFIELFSKGTVENIIKTLDRYDSI